MILRGIFHVVSCFPLKFMLYCGNLDYFSDSVECLGYTVCLMHPLLSPFNSEIQIIFGTVSEPNESLTTRGLWLGSHSVPDRISRLDILLFTRQSEHHRVRKRHPTAKCPMTKCDKCPMTKRSQGQHVHCATLSKSNSGYENFQYTYISH